MGALLFQWEGEEEERKPKGYSKLFSTVFMSYLNPVHEVGYGAFV
jgi:hypothetical protein